jgi:DNA-binding Lrp family transcriptional regulator
MAKTQGPDGGQADAVDVKIIEVIIHNPQATVDGIAEQVRMSSTAIQKRLGDLFNDNKLGRAIIVKDWNYAGYPFLYRVDIKANMRLLQLAQGGPPGDGDEQIDSQRKLANYIKDTLAKRYRGRLIVVDVTILLGQAYDLSLVIRARSPKAVFLFVTEGLRVLGGVQETMTYQEAWSYGEPPLDLE